MESKNIILALNDISIIDYIKNITEIYEYECNIINIEKLLIQKEVNKNINVIITDSIQVVDTYKNILKVLILLPKGMTTKKNYHTNIRYIEYPLKNLINEIKKLED